MLFDSADELSSGRNDIMPNFLERPGDEGTGRASVPASVELFGKIIDVDGPRAAKGNLDLPMPEVAKENGKPGSSY